MGGFGLSLVYLVLVSVSSLFPVLVSVARPTFYFMASGRGGGLARGCACPPLLLEVILGVWVDLWD